MTGLEIGLLVLGAAFFIGSFFFTEKLSSSDLEAIEKLSENEINILLEKQMRQASDRIERTIDEKLITSLASAERQISKTTNEQIGSISEHADEVRSVINRDMEAVNKSHDEIVFMHTMLNDKQKKVTDIEREAQQLESQMRALKQGIEKELYSTVEKEKGVSAKDLIAEVQKTIDDANSPAPSGRRKGSAAEEDEKESPAESAASIVEDAKSLKDSFSKKLNEEIRMSNANEGIEVFENVNEKILALRKQGFSEVEIAKQLGKGLGEIKLVLGLFDEEA